MRRPLSPAAEMIIGAISTIVLNVGIAIAFIVIGMLSASVYPPLFSIAFVAPFVGLVQLAYILPICIYLQRRGRANWMKGIIIGACITVLLNGGCWILLGGGGMIG
jgi:heme/copper-type cytochrome/quinol oxidase subunit 4